MGRAGDDGLGKKCGHLTPVAADAESGVVGLGSATQPCRPGVCQSQLMLTKEGAGDSEAGAVQGCAGCSWCHLRCAYGFLCMIGPTAVHHNGAADDDGSAASETREVLIAAGAICAVPTASCA